MMRDEFTAMLRFLNSRDDRIPDYTGPVSCSDQEWRVIEFVYTWHPGIKDHMDIAGIYYYGGWPAIKAMYHDAYKYEEIWVEVNNTEKCLFDAKKRLDDMIQDRDKLREEILHNMEVCNEENL